MAWMQAVDRVGTGLIGMWMDYPLGTCHALLLSLFVVLCVYLLFDTIDTCTTPGPRGPTPRSEPNPELDWTLQLPLHLLPMSRWSGEEMGDYRLLSVAAAAPAA